MKSLGYLGVTDPQQPTELNVFPNPVSDNLVILMEKGLPISNIDIYSIEGMKVFNTPLGYPLIRGENLNIDVSGLVPGVYYCVINTGTNRITKSFVVVR